MYYVVYLNVRLQSPGSEGLLDSIQSGYLDMFK